MRETVKERLMLGVKDHMYYETRGVVHVAACGWRSVTVKLGEGEVNCEKCLRAMAATDRFIEKHGDCGWQLTEKGRLR